jgi:hypothetical protein
MEQKKPNYAQGIFLTKKKSKTGKEFLELSIKEGDGYKKFVCFESEKKDNYGNQMYSVMVKEEIKQTPKTDLPF